MVLFLDFIFWVSSLAYPNSLGTKGYVVVVVVVVVLMVLFFGLISGFHTDSSRID